MFGFKKTSVTHTISFHSLKPVFAFIFAWTLLKEAPTTVQMIALAPSFYRAYLLSKAKQKQTQYGFENKLSYISYQSSEAVPVSEQSFLQKIPLILNNIISIFGFVYKKSKLLNLLIKLMIIDKIKVNLKKN